MFALLCLQCCTRMMRRARNRHCGQDLNYSIKVESSKLLVASYGGDNACQFRVAAGGWACTFQLERMGASTVRCRGAQRKICVYWAWIYRSGAARHSANALRRFCI